jgi:hypothetical protein
MGIETTTNFRDKNEAQDSLAGPKNLPGFLVGYVRQKANQSFDVVTIFDCADSEPSTGQKPVLNLALGLTAVIASFAG